jgi:hypothetical protein
MTKIDYGGRQAGSAQNLGATWQREGHIEYVAAGRQAEAGSAQNLGAT